ncbi:hypothetical protein RBI89_19560 [Bacillus subtilis]|uniref:hypothetical protein n=1 Tax=Bacillus subtilis TaxID=1423 RepID=UPI0027E0E15E|nr:hypothetical protein [Bacillus subtilis]MDQ4711661.1 hypothetical protein [Bacillus subtilis]
MEHQFLNGFTLEKAEMTVEEFNKKFVLVIPAIVHQNAVLGDPTDDFEEEIVYTDEDEHMGNTGFIVYYPMDGKKLSRIYQSDNGLNIADEIKRVFHIVD